MLRTSLFHAHENPASRDGILVFDEMQVRNNLAYNKPTGELVGFVTLPEAEAEAFALSNNYSGDRKLVVSNHVLLFHWVSLGCNFDFPIAFFFTDNLHGRTLNRIVWDGVSRLELVMVKIALKENYEKRTKLFSENMKIPLDIFR
eukprot:GCRY01007507.1.p1 GENE.GCRY01007507.1~~GCRY01007507.1.p1  ORF type:complete len:145 (+),score=19.29 GCRY01007507.1:260-694(+)